MLWETLERVNRLRQQALANAEFVAVSYTHLTLPTSVLV